MPLMTEEPCPYCNGTGKVKPPGEQEQPCPWCQETTRHRTMWTTGDKQLDNYVFHHLQEVQRATQAIEVIGTSAMALPSLVFAAAYWFRQLSKIETPARDNNLRVLWSMAQALSKGDAPMGAWFTNMVESYCKVKGIDFKGQIQES